MEIDKEFGYDFDPVKDSRGKRVLREREPLPRKFARRPPSRRRKTKATPRKNRPFPNLETLSLECCEKKTCLLSNGRGIITAIRKTFDKMLYEAQNSYLISLLDIKLTRAKPRQIQYNIRDSTGLAKVAVCKTAFQKIFGIGSKRIKVLISKVQPYTGEVEDDLRQKFSRNQRKLPTTLKAEVVEHIRSYERERSHYTRRKTKDKQFLAADLSLTKIWKDFLRKKELTSNDALPLSFSSFRNIFRRFDLSFRKPRVDTCSKCDSLLVLMKYSNIESEVESARELKVQHTDQADQHYDSFKFDLDVLTKRRNQVGNQNWEIPPIWKDT